MENKVFLLSNKSRLSSDKDVYLNAGLERNEKLISNTDLAETLSLYDLYKSERDNCNKYRLVVDINPVCTNVLFNNVTEIIKDEGSENVKVVMGSGNTKGALGVPFSFNGSWLGRRGTKPRNFLIMDTEYSHEDIANLDYKPGRDMFNNHILRANDFVHVGLAKWTSGSDVEDFNTIKDYNRGMNGEKITMSAYEISYSKDIPEITSHIYNKDNITDTISAFKSLCVEKNGWFGFYNKTLIDIPNGRKIEGEDITDYTFNRVLNNKEACSFVNMYPDKSLFTFTPKYNKFRKRIERNWDYCITYPYSSDEKLFNKINGDNNKNAVKVYSHSLKYTNNGEELIEFKSMFKHTLKKGSNVSLFYKDTSVLNPDLERIEVSIKIASIGDSEGKDKEHIFSVKLSELSDYFEIVKVGNNNVLMVVNGGVPEFYYKKNYGNTDASYYFRKFKKLTRINTSGKTETYIPKNEINKLSFAENIFGDNISQLLFTEDIDVSDLRDNLGMPLSKIYLTIVKANRGNIEWYENNNFSDSSVEYSHAFGKVTAGVELPEDVIDYNVHKIHNIDLSKLPEDDYSAATKDVFVNFMKIPEVIDGSDVKGITVDDTDEFYGDIVELDGTTLTENVIEKVYFRFNTKQRETTNNENYFDVVEEYITHDDYDPEPSGHTVRTDYLYLNTNTNGEKYAGNLEPEGYFYDPHYEITLNEMSDEYEFALTDLVDYDSEDVSENIEEVTVDNDTFYKVTVNIDDDLNVIVGKTVVLYNILTKATTITSITNVNETNFSFVVNGDEFINIANDFKNYVYMLSLTDIACPSYAKFQIQSQGVIWKNLIKLSELSYESPLYNRPFANGALYIHKNVNFFLRRQDPYGDYFMQNPEDNVVEVKPMYMHKFRKSGYSKLIIDALDYISDNTNTDCI